MTPSTLLRRLKAAAGTWIAVLGLAAAAAPAHATTIVPLTIVDMLGHSDAIVVGQVQTVVDGFDSRGLPYTEVTIKVSDTIRGQNSGTYTFRQFGLDKPRRMADGRTYLGRPTGWPTWRRGESAIVFMYSKSRATGFQTTVGLGQGKLSLANGKAMNAYGNTRLFRGVKVNPSLLDESEKKMFQTHEGPVDADTLRKFLHRAVEGNWVRNGGLRNEQR
ncbi:MAG: hypothetical protein U1F08_03920 [Steroidobacteraceae bacterium]